tara:strand:+ start:154 stop:774 length:621 start_codon:yes stop_codon:yes gene_type:complete
MLINDKLINMLTHKQYILASSSKSRFQILKNCGLNFMQIKPICDEENIKNKIANKIKDPRSFAKRLSYEKALSVSNIKKYKNKDVIGCDTLIYINNTIMDKAKNFKEAKTKIKMLSGKSHKIVSGITICRNGIKTWQSSVTTDVKIKKLNDREINIYLKRAGKQILSSVGCYQIEALGTNIIENIKGDFFNVMGLPLFKLLRKISP